MRALARFWPATMAGRFALVLVAGLSLLLVTGAALHLHEGGGRTLGLFARNIAVRIAAMADLMDATAAMDRGRVLAALGGPMMRVSLSPVGPDLAEGGWRRPEELPKPIQPHFDILQGRPVFVRLLRPWQGGGDGAHTRAHRMAIAVGLLDGHWLQVRLHGGRPPWRWGPGPLSWLLLAIALVLCAAVWAAHRMTRPLRRFAQAADRFGVDVRAPPMPEHGSRELRRAARAFNQMQERLRRFVDDRTMMLAAISHDLRTALTRLRLRAEFIEEKEQQDKAIADIDEMQAMLDETLSFARDDVREEAHIETDLAALMQSLCHTLVDTGHAMHFNGPAQLFLQGRPIALRRAFGSLLDNALRYGDQAEVSLSERNGEAVVEILDHGPGIAAEMREKVFAPFFRLEGSRSRETGGTGLGLASARAVFHRHGGHISLHDGKDTSMGGLLVRVNLPIHGSKT
ncbi:MAG: ATP-binding protein [Proteobacteria bacterium]|nr:ATP-binding protein [Pseudomonadota bacterium]